MANIHIEHLVLHLAASRSTFTVLRTGGEVLTFGSTLHSQALGRTVDQSDPADSPCPVDFLGGIPIRKVASGGSITAALSNDNDLYIWAGQQDASVQITCLSGGDGQESVRLVDIDGGVDILDVGVGYDHLIVLTEKGDIWTTGNNRYGQLGIGSDEDFFQDWQKVPFDHANTGRTVVEVGASTWRSWYIVK